MFWNFENLRLEIRVSGVCIQLFPMYRNPTQSDEIQCEKAKQFSSNKHCENSDDLVGQESKLVSQSFRSVYCSVIILPDCISLVVQRIMFQIEKLDIFVE